jgi:hypothetical protein
MTLVVKHSTITGAPADSRSLVDGPAWDANHTLTGTADATQLNTNVVQAVVNDTNVTGSISAQSLTLSWSGTLADSRLGKTHLVVYTVAPNGASMNDKARADYVCNGTSDQTAIASAFAAASSPNSAVVLLPGSYTFNDTLNIPAAVNCVLYAEGTTINGPGGTKDTVSIASMIRCNYYFGTINHTGTGSAIHAVQFANGSWITAQSINGSSHQGKGIYIDASTTGSSTGYIRLGWVHGFDKGIHFYSKTVIDTHVVWLNYGFDCNYVIYDETDVGASAANNSMTWNVNLDTQWTGSASFAGVWTNGDAHVINGTIGSTVGGTYGPNVKLDTLHGFAATEIVLNLTPQRFAYESGNVVNTSGNTNHIMLIGMPLGTASNPTRAGALGYNAGTLNYGDGVANHVLVSTDQVQSISSKTFDKLTVSGAFGNAIGASSPGNGWGLYHAGTITATSGFAINWQADSVLTAAANGDALQGMRITVNPAKGAFTGVTSYGLYIKSLGSPYDFGIRVDDISPVYFGGSVSVVGSLGYTTGAGGTVTQATSKSTGVTLNKLSGAITMNAAALAAGTIVSFTLTNSTLAATDVLILNHISGGTPGSYSLNARCAAGSATIDVRNNTSGSLSEAIVIQFAVIKAVNA